MVRKRRFFIKAVVGTILLALLTWAPSCGGGSSQNQLSTSPIGSLDGQGNPRPEPMVGNPEMQPGAEVTLEEALHQLSELPTPDGVDNELFLQLKTALSEALVAQKKDKFTLQVPGDESSQVSDFWIINEDDGSVAFEWSYSSRGDYDNNGEVAISDITPIALFYQASWNDEDWLEARIADGDHNGEVNLADITQIALNFGAVVDRYKVETATDPASSTWVQVGEDIAVDGSAFEVQGTSYGKRFKYSLTSPDPDLYYRVRAYLGNEAGGSSNIWRPANQEPQAIPSGKMQKVSATDVELIGSTSDTLTLGGESESGIKLGQILYSETGEFNPRIVVSIGKEDGNVVVTTTNAGLSDMFERLDLNVSGKLGSETVEWIPSGDDRVEVSFSVEEGEKTASWGVEASGNVSWNWNWALLDTPEGLSVSGTSWVDAGLTIGANIEWFQLVYFGAEFECELGTHVDAVYSASFDYDNFDDPIDLGTLHIGNIWIGTTGIFFRVQIPVTLNFSASGEITIQLHPEAVYQATAGIEWTPSTGWNPYGSHNLDFDYGVDDPLQGTLTARAALVPSIQVLLFGLAGPYLALEAPYIQFDAEMDSGGADAELHIGMTGTIGIETGPLPWDVLDDFTYQVFDIDRLLWSDHWDFNQAYGHIYYPNGGGAPYVTVLLENELGETLPPALTDEDGLYEFNGLVWYDYTVTPQMPQWSFNPASRDFTMMGATVEIDDFIGTPPSHLVQGYVRRSNGQAIRNVRVEISGAESGHTYSSTSGYYSFANLVEGEYTAEYSRPGFDFSPQQQDFTVDGPETLPQVTGPPWTFSISGYVRTSGGDGISDVLVSASGPNEDSDTTNASGYYIIDGLEGTISDTTGRYEVVATKADYDFNPPSDTVTIVSSNVSNVNFTGSSNQTVTGNTGVGSALVTIRDSSDQYVDSTTSNGSGDWTIELPPYNGYRAIPTKAGWHFTPTQRIFNVVDQDVTVPAFTAAQNTVSGSVVRELGGNFADVFIQVTGRANRQAYTEPDGSWSISGLPNGNYSVAASKGGWWFTFSAGTSFTVSNNNVTFGQITGRASMASVSINGVSGDGGINTPFILDKNQTYTLLVNTVDGNIGHLCEFRNYGPFYRLQGTDVLETLEFGPKVGITVHRESPSPGDPAEPITFYVKVWTGG